MTWNPWRFLTVLGIVAIVVFAAPLVPVKTTTVWCCPVSGSTKRLTRWFGGFPREVRTTSALEVWLKKREPAFEPRFEFVSMKTDQLIGNSHGSAPAPAIYGARPYLEFVIRWSGDEKIAGLVAVLRNGSNEERRRAVSEIVDEAIDAESKSFPMP